MNITRLLRRKSKSKSKPGGIIRPPAPEAERLIRVRLSDGLAIVPDNVSDEQKRLLTKINGEPTTVLSVSEYQALLNTQDRTEP